MQRYEYKVVPAPVRGEKVKGIKGTDARFAYKLTELMNALARDGWEYLRADSLPCEERTGLTRSLTVTQLNLLVFRRMIAAPVPVTAEAPAASAAPAQPAPSVTALHPLQPAPAIRTTGAPLPFPQPLPVDGPRRLTPLPAADPGPQLTRRQPDEGSDRGSS